MKIAKKNRNCALGVSRCHVVLSTGKNTASGECIAAFEADTQPDAQVTQILENTCYDYHSDHTE